MDFYDLEKNEEIISYKISNILIWPLIRWRFYLFINGFNSNEKNKKITFNFTYLIKSFTKFPSFPHKHKIIFFGTDISNVLQDRRYFNRINDYYIFLYPENTISLEKTANRVFKEPRIFQNNYNYDLIDILAHIKYKIYRKINKKNNKQINNFIDLLGNNILIENNDLKIIKSFVIKKYLRSTYKEKMIRNLFNKIKPKIVFLNAAYYGGESYIIKVAKEMGIKTAEFQHGAVSKSHPAYNYGEAILNSEEYKKYTPDYYLTYGEYWNKQIKIPGKTFVVGNPHFHESIKKYRNIKEEKNTILIVSQWTLTKDFVDIAKKLSIKFPNKKIIFKLHPNELKNYEIIKPLEKYKNIEIKKDGDIYELLAKYEDIVACYSTTIFEALAFKKNIYILDNDYSKMEIPESLGVRFKSKEELVNLIQSKTKNEYEHDIEYYFNSNWKENYKRFIEEEVGINIDDKKYS